MCHSSLLILVGQQESGGAAVGFGDDPQLAERRVVGREQAKARAQREIVLGFVFGAQVAPIAFQVALEISQQVEPCSASSRAPGVATMVPGLNNMESSFLGKQKERPPAEARGRLWEVDVVSSRECLRPMGHG